MAVTVTADLRHQFGPARDQDPRPTCMAFAASDTHAAARPAWEPLSAEWAYFHALQRDGGAPDEGVTMTSMRESLRIDGQPVEAEWEYIAADITDVAAWRPPKVKSALFKRESDDCGASFDQICEQIDADHPVLLITSISRSFDFGWDADFVIAGAEAPVPDRLHAVVGVGHGSRADRRLLLIRNSWGASWADHGYAWLDEAYLQPRLVRACIVTREV